MGLLKAKAAQAAPAPATPPTLARMDSDDPMERRRAIQQCVEQPDAVAALVGLLRHEPEHIVRQTAFLELAVLGSAEAAQGLAELLSDADPALRNGALEAMASMPEQSRHLLAPLGICDDPDVRIFAVLLAAELPTEDTVDWLIDMARGEQDANVCSNLAEALGATGHTRALPVLQMIMDRFPTEPFLAFAVQTAMSRLQEG